MWSLVTYSNYFKITLPFYPASQTHLRYVCVNTLSLYVHDGIIFAVPGF